MSTPEEDKFDFEELKLPDDLSGSLEPFAEPAPEESIPEQAEAEEAPAEEDRKTKKKEKTRKKEKTEPEEMAAVEGQRSARDKIGNIMQKLTAADPFTVMLSVALAAIVIAILCCLVELGRYGFDIRAKNPLSTITITAPSDISHSSS